MKLRSYKITVVAGVTNPHIGFRIHILQLAVHDGIVNPEVLLFSTEAWLHLTEYVHTQEQLQL
jgi:hypothetical protein